MEKGDFGMTNRPRELHVQQAGVCAIYVALKLHQSTGVNWPYDQRKAVACQLIATAANSTPSSGPLPTSEQGSKHHSQRRNGDGWHSFWYISLR